jgi:predicted O-methyltransferase YrrM
MKDNAPPAGRKKSLKLPIFGFRSTMEDVFSRYKKEFTDVLRRELAEQFMRSKPGFIELIREEIQREVRVELEREVQRILNFVQESDFTVYRNVQYAAQRIAVMDSARFAQEHMAKVPTFNHPEGTLRHALSLAPKGGLTLEFGVFSGKTLKIIAETRADGRVYGFDSFEGLPEDWRSGFEAGAFAVPELPVVEGAELVVGWFDATLPKFLDDHPGVVDFLHVDCDLYSSSKTVLDLVGPRLRPGSIVLFDEFFNYPGWQAHEYKAWVEYLERSGVRYQYECYTFNNEQVALRILD